jgi:acetyl-CoA acetyltransferase
MANEVAILGVGMHPWGRWAKPLSELGVIAARAALQDAGLAWKDVSLVSCGAASRCGTQGHLSASTFAEALGWQGAELATIGGGCVAGAHALSVARNRIISGECDVALALCADLVPRGVLGLDAQHHVNDPNHVRHALGFTNPVYLGLEARRRVSTYGTTEDDLASVKVKNARHGLHNPNARYRYVITLDQVKRSALIADPLRLLHICATSDGAAAVALSSIAFARRRSLRYVTLLGLSTASSTYPNPRLEMPYLASDAILASNGESFRTAVIRKLYESTGVGPKDLSMAEIYDLSSVSELEWYEHLGLCAVGEAENFLREGHSGLGGSVPVNPSGGLASFGEAVAAQALAQVCELTWQLRDQAADRQVPDAQIGIAVSQGTFGLGAAIMLKR